MLCRETPLIIRDRTSRIKKTMFVFVQKIIGIILLSCTQRFVLAKTRQNLQTITKEIVNKQIGCTERLLKEEL